MQIEATQLLQCMFVSLFVTPCKCSSVHSIRNSNSIVKRTDDAFNYKCTNAAESNIEA